MADHMPCDIHDSRIGALEKRADEHSASIKKAETALSDGRVQFAELRKDIQAVTAAVRDLTDQLRREQAAKPGRAEKIEDAAIHWGVPIVCAAILWAVVRSGGVPGVTH